MNVIYVVALFRWKKWGFWGISLNSAIACFTSIYYEPLSILSILGAVLSSLLGILILYWALNIGKDIKAWSRLT